MTDAATFLDALPVFSEFEDVANPRHYKSLPEGWMLAVADVVASGAAIAAGRYKVVNMAGAAVITAVLNTLGRADYPFAFGGDGAVVAVPRETAEAVRTALAAVAAWVSADLGLTLRVALVPVADARAAGREVEVARFRTSDALTFAMFSGGGSAWAEAEMKAGRYAIPPAPPGTQPDLDGLSCRWSPMRARHGHILSIIAVPTEGGDPQAFRSLVSGVVALASRHGAGNPLPEEGPRPGLFPEGFGTEVRARAPKGARFKAGAQVAFEIALNFVLHRTGLSVGRYNARDYGRQLVRNTDFRKFDDGLKMTVDIDADGQAAIGALLDRNEAAGVCIFGLHAQDTALVTCIVPSAVARDHIHFVDGGTGGYAEAALRIKEKIADAALNSP